MTGTSIKAIYLVGQRKAFHSLFIKGNYDIDTLIGSGNGNRKIMQTG